MTAIEQSTPTRYPDVRNYIGGTFVEPERDGHLDVTNPTDGTLLSRVPLSGMAEVDRAVEAAKKAQPGWAATPIKERVQVFYRYKALLEKNIDELAALVTEENGKIRSEARGGSAQVGGALRVRLLAAADHPRRSARSFARRRVPRRALSGRRRRLDHAVQLPEHGSELDDPQRDRPRQLHDPQAVRAGAAQRGPHRRAAARSRTARRRASTSCTADRRRSKRSAIIPASKRSASSARRRSRRSSIAAAPRISSACSRSAARRITSSSCPTPSRR